MFHRTRSLSLVAASIAVLCAASAAPAHADADQRDAAAFPCTTRNRLSVVQDQQGFSITNAKPDKAPAPAIARVPLGVRLKLDRALFVDSAESSKEASDALRR